MIFDAFDLTESDMNQPLRGLTCMDNLTHPVLGTYNPYSKISCLVLYLYSMEIGTPQLYAEVNRVARDMDLTYLKELGPYLKALFEVTYFAEMRRKDGDKVPHGTDLSDVSWNMAGSFLLFRGAPMKE